MKKISLITLMFFFININSFCQTFEKTMIGDKIYDGSEAIEIDPCGTSGVKIKILKNGISGGYMIFMCESNCGEYSHVWGLVSLYLDDNSVLKLADKKRYDCVNQIAYTIYDLTQANIASLKKTNISAIRFTDKHLNNILIYNKDCSSALHTHESPYQHLLPEHDKKNEYGSDKYKKYEYTAIFKSLFK